MHRVKFLVIKPNRCINFSNLFLKWNSTRLGQFLCPSSGIFHRKHSNYICHAGLLTACEQDQDGNTVPSWSCPQAISKPVWHKTLQCVQWKNPDEGQRNCPKQVEFHFKNKFEKLLHLVGFIMRNLSRCTVTWTSDSLYLVTPMAHTIVIKVLHWFGSILYFYIFILFSYFHFILLMYLTSVLYIPVDDHYFGRNLRDFIVCKT